VNLLSPRIELPLADLRNATVVQNKGDTRTSFNDASGQRQLSGQHTEIEREAIPFEEPDVLQEGLALAQLVRLGVQDAPNAFQIGVSHDLLQIVFEILVLRPAGGHDTLQRIVLRGHLQNVAGLIQHERLIYVGFQMNGLPIFPTSIVARPFSTGTIRSSVPWMTSAGASMRCRKEPLPATARLD